MIIIINDIAVISKELNLLGYITSLIHDNDSSILLFYKDSSESEIIFGISQSKSFKGISVGNIMLTYDERPSLTYNSILKENTYSFNTLMKAIKAIEIDVNNNYSKDYICNEMLLEEKFKSPKNIINLFISINNYTPQNNGSQGR